MSLTLNEVYRTCQKAAEGAGVPAGLDIDAARNTAWLVARNFAVLDALPLQLERAAGTGACCFDGRDMEAATLHAAGKLGALLAPALVDLLIACADGPAGRLTVTGLSAPLYLLPAAADYVDNGWCFRFELRGPRDMHFVLNIDAAGASVLGPAGTDVTALADGTGFKLVAHCTHAADILPAAASPLVVLVSRDALAAAGARSLAEGIETATASWRRLDELACKVLVPASAESRARGAGGGDNESRAGVLPCPVT